MSASPLNLYDVDAYTATKKGQVVANYAGDSVELEYVFDVAAGPGPSTTDNSILTIPSGSAIESCDVFVVSTVSGGVNFSLGLQQADGTEIDNDGLAAAVTATTGYVAGAGALIGAAIAAGGQLVLGGTRTAGALKVVVTYRKA